MLHFQATFLLLLAVAWRLTALALATSVSVPTAPLNMSTTGNSGTVLLPKVSETLTSLINQADWSKPSGLSNVSLSLGKFGNNLTLDDCEDWDKWEAPSNFQDIWQYYRSGYDEEGNVVYVNEFGKLNLKKLEGKSGEIVQEFLKYYEQSLLRIEYDARQDSNDGEGVVMIYDLEGFTLANYASSAALQFSLKMFTTVARLNKSIKYGFSINVNFAGELFLQLAKPYLGNVLDKFELYGTRGNKWKPKLLNKIPAAYLPPKYGGSSSWRPLPMHVCKVLDN